MSEYTYRIWETMALAFTVAFLVAHLELSGGASNVALGGSVVMLGFLILDRLGGGPRREVNHE